MNEPQAIEDLLHENIHLFHNRMNFVSALTLDNKLLAWGINDHGQLGYKSNHDAEIFNSRIINYFNDKNIEQISCGSYYTLVLTSGCIIYEWGANKRGPYESL